MDALPEVLEDGAAVGASLSRRLLEEYDACA